jgi:hypothetical protein
MREKETIMNPLLSLAKDEKKHHQAMPQQKN